MTGRHLTSIMCYVSLDIMEKEEQQNVGGGGINNVQVRRKFYTSLRGLVCITN